MIRLQERLFLTLEEPGGIHLALQTALELEHATIPPYLLAGYSLKSSNAKIRGLILDVAREEMLHMMLVANLINAIGGSPNLKHANFVPVYPASLPGAVQHDLIVPLAPFSMELLRDTFMKIEEPEHPRVFPVVEAEAAGPRTIGQFYERIKAIIREAGTSLFVGDRARQIELTVDDDDSIVVTDVDSAVRAIELIVGQGEGTSKTPFDEAGLEPAHYYRFEQILKGNTLRPDATVKEGFSFGAPPITFDPDGVFPVTPNLKVGQLPIDSAARQLAEDFNRLYTEMLLTLHAAFNGERDQMGHAVNIMERLKGLAKQLVQIELAPGMNAGPTFEFVAP